jgi:DNA-binding protein HU-beta
MQKTDFVEQVAERSGLGKGDAASAVDAVLDSITDRLKAGDAISFTGFGKFSVSDRAARAGVNPSTRERIEIAATRVPKFTAGSQLKAAVKSS